MPTNPPSNSTTSAPAATFAQEPAAVADSHVSSSVGLTRVGADVPLFASLLWLVGAAGILTCAALLQVGQGREVLLPWAGRALPETCTMHTRLGVDCPGCGLTRSFIHLIRGDVVHAWSLSPVGLLVFSFVVLQVPISLLFVFRISNTWVKRLASWNQIAFVGLIIALALQWLFRLLVGDLV